MSKTSPAQILDVLAKRPDLTLEHVQRLLETKQTKPPLTKASQYRRALFVASATIAAIICVGLWLGGFPFERGAPLLFCFIGWVAASGIAAGILSDVYL